MIDNLTYEELLTLCDRFELPHPATKEAALQLLRGKCPGCVKSLKKNYTITYIYPQKTVTKHKPVPCKSCGK